MLAVTLLSAGAVHSSAGFLVGEVAYELAAGAGIGLAVGLAGAAGLRRVALPASGLYPIAVLSFVVAGYGAASAVHASGFLAVYVSALVLGNIRLPHRAATRGFAEGVAWLAQIGLFVMLGLLASPSRLPAQIWPAVVIGLVLTLVARPAAVLLSTLAFRVPWREKAFLSYAGLRGAVPIVLATIPLSSAIPDSARLFDLVFLIVGVFTLVQGPTLPAVARRLGVLAATEASRLDIESAPLEDLRADLLQVRIPEGSAAARRGTVRTAAAEGRRAGADRQIRARIRARARHAAAGGRPAADRRGGFGAGSDGAAAACRQPGGQARRLVRRARPLSGVGRAVTVVGCRVREWERERASADPGVHRRVA